MARKKYKPRESRLNPNGLLISYGDKTLITCKGCGYELPGWDQPLTPTIYKKKHKLTHCPKCKRELDSKFNFKGLRRV